MAHFKGRDTEHSEAIDSIYRGAVGVLVSLIQDVQHSGMHLLVLRPAPHVFEMFPEIFQEAESAIRREREHAADRAAVSASSASAAASALVKAHASAPVWKDIEAEVAHLSRTSS